jgi:hypothetical protein
VVGWLGVLMCLLAGRLVQLSRRQAGDTAAFSGCVFPTLILIIGATWAVIVAGRLVSVIAGASGHGWLAGTAILVAVAVLHVGSALLYARTIGKFMATRSSDEPLARKPEGTPGEPLLAELEFREYSARVDLPPDADGDRIAARVQHPGALLFQRGLLVALGAGALVTVAVSFSLARDRGELLNMLKWQAPSVLLAFVVVAGVSYARGRVGLAAALVSIGVANIWKPMFAGLFNVTGIPIAPPEARWLLVVPPAASLAITFAFFVWARGRIAGGIHLEAIPARRLLLLRVFGVFANTQALFRLVAGSWQSTGPVFTIADPGYARLQFGRGRFFVLFAALAPLVLLIAILGFDMRATTSLFASYEPIFVAIYLPSLVAYFLYQRSVVRQRFARNADAIRQRIAFESGEEGLLRYQQGTAYCYADTWKEALGELIDWTDIVLMDLRGFNQARQGCQHELGVLVDGFPLDRLVLLLDETTDGPLLKQVMTERWRRADAGSPNRRSGRAPVVALYRASNRLLSDLPKVIGLLGRAAAHAPGRTAGPLVVARLERDARRIRFAVVAAASVIGLGIVLQLVSTGGKINIVQGQRGLRAYAGISIAWLGVILLMLATRTRTLLERDGHARHMFAGFPWPQIFWMLTASWLVVHSLTVSHC